MGRFSPNVVARAVTPQPGFAEGLGSGLDWAAQRRARMIAEQAAKEDRAIRLHEAGATPAPEAERGIGDIWQERPTWLGGIGRVPNLPQTTGIAAPAPNIETPAPKVGPATFFQDAKFGLPGIQRQALDLNPTISNALGADAAPAAPDDSYYIGSGRDRMRVLGPQARAERDFTVGLQHQAQTYDISSKQAAAERAAIAREREAAQIAEEKRKQDEQAAGRARIGEAIDPLVTAGRVRPEYAGILRERPDLLDNALYPREYGRGGAGRMSLDEWRTRQKQMQDDRLELEHLRQQGKQNTERGREIDRRLRANGQAMQADVALARSSGSEVPGSPTERLTGESMDTANVRRYAAADSATAAARARIAARGNYAATVRDSLGLVPVQREAGGATTRQAAPANPGPAKGITAQRTGAAPVTKKPVAERALELKNQGKNAAQVKAALIAEGYRVK